MSLLGIALSPTFRRGDRVRIHSEWSNFDRERGVVLCMLRNGCISVRLDGSRGVVLFFAGEVCLEAS